PYLAVVAGLHARPDPQDETIEHDPPRQPLFLDHARIAQEFLQISPHPWGVGAVGRPKVEQQHADASRGRGGAWPWLSWADDFGAGAGWGGGSHIVHCGHIETVARYSE